MCIRDRPNSSLSALLTTEHGVHVESPDTNFSYLPNLKVNLQTRLPAYRKKQLPAPTDSMRV